MDVEELTKSQIILLVLLVSFVTSIATGIVTVSLLAQTPPAITQTINRVVERTVETVVPSENQASVVTKETTVVVKEDDLISETIGSGFSKIARIHEGTATSSPVVALGAVTGSGTVVTDAAFVSKEHAVSFGDAAFQFVVSASIPELGVAFLTATGTPPSSSSFKGADIGSLKLGQTTLALFGARSNRVATGIVSAVSVVEVGGEAREEVRIIETTVSETLTPGTPLLSIFGDLLGVSTGVSRAEGRAAFVAFSDINAALERSLAPAETEP